MRRLPLFFFAIVLTILSGCDPCRSITCLNDGSCINGECACPDGYTAPDCSKQLTPDVIRIDRIDVTRFPATKEGGASWDVFSGPDIFPELRKDGSAIYNRPSEFYQNADPSIVHTFWLDPPAEIKDPTKPHVLWLMDYDDLLTPESMGGVPFLPYHDTNGFPTTFELDDGGDIAFIIHVSYVW